MSTASTGGRGCTWCRSMARWALSEITAGKVQEYRVHLQKQAMARVWEAAGAQHHAPGNRGVAADAENRLRLPYHEQQRMIGHAGVAELADATDLRRT